MGKSVRIVDLSVNLENFAAEPNAPVITYWDHSDFARNTAKLYGVSPADFPEPGVGGSVEHVALSSHAGTHLDAPWQFGPTSEGKPAKTIDQVPLEWCYGDGVKLDFGETKKPGEYIEVADLQAELRRIDYHLEPGNIVLIRTGAEDHWGKPKFAELASGLSEAAVFWLIDHGIKVMGTDAYTAVRSRRSGCRPAAPGVERAATRVYSNPAVEKSCASTACSSRCGPRSGGRLRQGPAGHVGLPLVSLVEGSGLWKPA